MARFLLLVGTNPASGRDDEFNAWYDEQHLRDLLAVDGVVAAQRYRLAETEPAQQSPHGYFAIYDLEADSADTVRGAIAAAATSGRIAMTDALDRSSILQVFLEPVGEPRSTS